MCGIYGTHGFIDTDLMDAMDAALLHRGPDEHGFYQGDGVCLGHRRLSIIDLAHGRQPIHNEDKTVWITYNGELYNFPDLKQDLLSKGHRFYTATDTEVIVHAYEEYGEACCEKLNGIFAFALWDAVRKKMVLARDRLGVKPLYYCRRGSRLVFSSELKALLRWSAIDASDLNASKITEFMAWRHTSAPDTIIKGVKKLPPGGMLVLQGDSEQLRSYWQLSAVPEQMDEAEACRQFREHLRTAVHSQLVADVPVGVLLSGGIDSSAIVALAAEVRESLHTFSIGFAGDPMSELPAARRVADIFGTRHAELTVTPGDLRMVPQIIRLNDEPVAGPSSLAYYLMFEKIREQGIKVILLGHGADEIAGGYEHLKLLPLMRRLRTRFVTRCPITLGIGLAGRLFKHDRCIRRIDQLFRHADNQNVAYHSLLAVCSPEELRDMLQGEAAAGIFNPLVPFLRPGVTAEDAVLAYEMGPWLADDLLHRVDRMSMAHSIEGRVPFLDNRLVDFSLKVPFHLKVHAGSEKHIFKQAMQGILPRQTIERKKQRFTTPVDSFFGQHFLDVCERLFREDNMLNETVFQRDFLLDLLQFQRRPSYRYFLRFNRLFAQFFARQIWNVFTLQLWFKTVVEGKDCAYLFND